MTIFQIMLLMCTSGTGSITNIDAQCRNRILGCVNSMVLVQTANTFNQTTCMEVEGKFQSGDKRAYIRHDTLINEFSKQRSK